MRCLRCGKELEIDSIYCHCPECIAQIEKEEKEKNSLNLKNDYEPPREDFFQKIVINLLGIVCALLALLYFPFIDSGKHSEMLWQGFGSFLLFAFIPSTVLSLFNLLLIVIDIRMFGLKESHILPFLFSLSMLVIGIVILCQ